MALIVLMGAALFSVTACNKSKSAAESAGQAKDEAAGAAQSAVADVPDSRLNGSWLFSSSPDVDGYYTLNNGIYEYYNSRSDPVRDDFYIVNNGEYELYNSRSSNLITYKGTYTLSGDIITFTTTHQWGGTFELHKNVLYTKDEVKARYETAQELTDDLLEEYFPGTFGSLRAKYIQDANPDNDMFISQGGIMYKRILADGNVAEGAPRSSEPADFAINGTVLEKYNGNEMFVIIPDGVTEIGIRAFGENKTITNVVLPGDVTAVMAGAFLSCTGLISVNIPNGVTQIGSGAFYECTSLARVRIPESVTQIDEFAFQKCTGIKRLEIPESVKWIGNYAFGGWTSSQTIIVRGKDDEAGADAAWGPHPPAQNGEYFWRGQCNAKIFYTS